MVVSRPSPHLYSNVGFCLFCCRKSLLNQLSWGKNVSDQNNWWEFPEFWTSYLLDNAYRVNVFWTLCCMNHCQYMNSICFERIKYQVRKCPGHSAPHAGYRLYEQQRILKNLIKGLFKYFKELYAESYTPLFIPAISAVNIFFRGWFYDQSKIQLEVIRRFISLFEITRPASTSVSPRWTMTWNANSRSNSSVELSSGCSLRIFLSSSFAVAIFMPSNLSQ